MKDKTNFWVSSTDEKTSQILCKGENNLLKENIKGSNQKEEGGQCTPQVHRKEENNLELTATKKGNRSPGAQNHYLNSKGF